MREDNPLSLYTASRMIRCIIIVYVCGDRIAKLLRLLIICTSI